MATVSKTDLELFERLTSLATEFHADALNDFVSGDDAPLDPDEWRDLFEQQDASLTDPDLTALGIKHVMIGKDGFDWFMLKRKWGSHELIYENFRKAKYIEILEHETGFKELSQHKALNAGEEQWVMDHYLQAHQRWLQRLSRFSKTYVRAKKVRQKIGWCVFINRCVRGCDRMKQTREDRSPFKSPFKTLEDVQRFQRRKFMEEWFSRPWGEIPGGIEKSLIYFLHVAIENDLSPPDVREKQEELYRYMVTDFEKRARRTGDAFEIISGDKTLKFGVEQPSKK